VVLWSFAVVLLVVQCRAACPALPFIIPLGITPANIAKEKEKEKGK
jgi:hypothetical protein